ncbi:hypothetical protein BCR32DRAFT_242561 [Anaeromyces robustus]|uniref:Uncharacterized protein n=1 Tax=Anaeromyces robustus TaxID=1754192 RepID=A0A1Y1XF74_9FUNG|nr:hypothetical protein BCR32DRAFT_242561 [Anaeromyces robustus]|eukprot:ORX84420.1 hypothetical protein BCR32DRAFT_242561 [Anaeromyces robustus]
MYHVINIEHEINFLRLKIQRLLSTNSSSLDIMKKRYENSAIEEKIKNYSNKNKILKECIRMENKNLIMSLYKKLDKQKFRREKTFTIATIKLQHIHETIENLSKESVIFMDISKRLNILHNIIFTKKFKPNDDLLNKEENEIIINHNDDLEFLIYQTFSKLNIISNENYNKKEELDSLERKEIEYLEELSNFDKKIDDLTREREKQTNNKIIIFDEKPEDLKENVNGENLKKNENKENNNPIKYMETNIIKYEIPKNVDYDKYKLMKEITVLYEENNEINNKKSIDDNKDSGSTRKIFQKDEDYYSNQDINNTYSSININVNGSTIEPIKDKNNDIETI